VASDPAVPQRAMFPAPMSVTAVGEMALEIPESEGGAIGGGSGVVAVGRSGVQVASRTSAVPRAAAAARLTRDDGMLWPSVSQ
jgi:hypothetical protein